MACHPIKHSPLLENRSKNYEKELDRDLTDGSLSYSGIDSGFGSSLAKRKWHEACLLKGGRGRNEVNLEPWDIFALDELLLLLGASLIPETSYLYQRGVVYHKEKRKT